MVLSKLSENTWKPISGFENYWVNPFGQVQSLYSNKKLKSYTNQSDGGRLAYSLTGKKTLPSGKCISVRGYLKVSRIVAIAYVPNPRPDIFTLVDHIDGNVRNNAHTNLRWVNRRLNGLNRSSQGRKLNSSNVYVAVVSYWNQKFRLGTYNNPIECLAVQDKIRKELFQKAYDYNTRPMCYSEPTTWRITKYGVNTRVRKLQLRLVAG